MKSGLYAWAGASATASAAACANRFDDPMTKLSNVYFGFAPGCVSCGAVGEVGCCTGSTGSAGVSATVSATRTSRPSESFVAARSRPRKWFSIHSRVKSFGNDDDEDAVVQRPAGRSREPGVEGRLVECVPQSLGDVVPESVGCGLVDMLHGGLGCFLFGVAGPREHTTLPTPRRGGDTDPIAEKKLPICRSFFRLHTTIHSCGKAVR